MKNNCRLYACVQGIHTMIEKLKAGFAILYNRTKMSTDTKNAHWNKIINGNKQIILEMLFLVGFQFG